MAGLEILVLVIWVRILVPQPDPSGFYDVLSWSYCLNRKRVKSMFNKIVASVISSVVLFACNVKEDASVDAADVVAESQNVSAPEASKTEAVVQPGVITPVPSVSTSAPGAATSAGEAVGGAAPLAAPVANVVVTGSSVSTSTPVSTGLSAGITSNSPAVMSTTTVPVK